MTDIAKLKELRNALSCWQDDYDPADDKEQYEMFGAAIDAVERLERAEAKLAELEKQEPVLFRDSHGCFVSKGKGEQLIKSCEFVTPYYIRPAPAVNLADLVPDVEKWRSPEAVRAQMAYRTLLLRKIEEAKK